MTSESAAAELLEGLRLSPCIGRYFRREAMRALKTLPNYDWCGIYRMEGEELVLDEFEGEPTEHARIPVGRGVCGTAVAENRNQVIDDVRNLENYLSCSVQTRSEIVVLIRHGQDILGQIDIDGHVTGAFGGDDERMLEQVASLIAERW